MPPDAPTSGECVPDYQAAMNVQMNADRLHRMLGRLTYREGWSFSIVAHAGWTRGLQIRLNVPDSNTPRGGGMSVQLLVDHQFQVPYFPMGDDEIERWLLDCILLVERHEACENFRLDGVAPYYPEHGHGADPYRLHKTALHGSSGQGHAGGDDADR